MNESSTSERKHFLIGLIAKALDDYESGDIGLGSLISKVEAGIDALSDLANGDWVEDLGSTWFELEIVYALVLDEGRSVLTDEEQADIDAAIAKLRSLLVSRPDLA